MEAGVRKITPRTVVQVSRASTEHIPLGLSSHITELTDAKLQPVKKYFILHSSRQPHIWSTVRNAESRPESSIWDWGAWGSQHLGSSLPGPSLPEREAPKMEGCSEKVLPEGHCLIWGPLNYSLITNKVLQLTRMVGMCLRCALCNRKAGLC